MSEFNYKVVSESELNVLDGLTVTTAKINLLTQGVASGYKIARGVATIGAASVV